MAGNTAGGGGADLVKDPQITLTINYSLIGHNANTGLTEAQTPDASGNLIGSAAEAGIVDPMLDMLADNGGPTETHALMAGSPAIDAGDPSIVFNPAEHDQGGAPFARISGGRIDMGAFDSQAIIVPPGLPGDYNQDDFVAAADYVVWRKMLGTTSRRRLPARMATATRPST